MMRQSKSELFLETRKPVLLYGQQLMIAFAKLERLLRIHCVRKFIYFAKYQRETSK